MKLLPTLILLATALAAAGCADKASMDARYDASLQRWKGATRAELEAAWGKPALATASSGDTVLTWVVRNDMDERPGANGSPVVVVTHTANGGIAGATVIPGAPAPATVPITCTTHFAVRDGHVASWKFEGLGCGAPY